MNSRDKIDENQGGFFENYRKNIWKKTETIHSIASPSYNCAYLLYTSTQQLNT